ncbi:hypothetical protein [Rhodocaloribacter sp.]
MLPRFLPALDQTRAPDPPGGEGTWTRYDAGPSALLNISNVLAVPQTDTPAEKLKSVPSPWARLLLFEQALFSRQHPVHQQILQEWRGLLGVIALAEFIQLRLVAIPVDLDDEDPVVQALANMVPDEHAQLWRRKALLWVDDQLIGGTSPRTLVFTGIRPDVPPTIPFQREGRLIDPVRHYEANQDAESLSLLREWIEKTHDTLHNQLNNLEAFVGVAPAGPGAEPFSRASAILSLLEAWKQDASQTLNRVGRPAAQLSQGNADSPLHTAFPADHPAYPVLEALKPIIPSEKVSNQTDFRLRDSEQVIDPGSRGRILRHGNPYTGRVRLPRGASRQVRDGSFELPTTAAQLGDPNAPDLGALFSSRLFRIVQPDTDNVVVLEAGGQHFLFPFNEAILDHLTPEQLAGWTTITGDAASGLTIRLEVPLRNDLSIRYEARFTPQDVITDMTTPEVAVWPDFVSEQWQHYYYFIRQPQARGGLPIKPVGSVSESSEQPGRGLSWGRTPTHPVAWVASARDAGGLFFTRQASFPERRPTTNAWNASIDFGSTHTRVFRKTQDVGGNIRVEPVILKPRTRMLLGPPAQLPLHFFVAKENEIGSTEEPRSLLWFPLSRVPDDQEARQKWLPADGIIYWKSELQTPDTQGLRSNLKWHQDDSEDQVGFQSYIAQLYLLVAAEAADAGASVQSVITAYPSVFPEYLRIRHMHQWRELHARFGVEVHEPLPESTALASYITHERGGTPGVNLLAIDVGGSTADLAVWHSSERTTGDSVRLAGNLLSRLVAGTPEVRELIARAAPRPPINVSNLSLGEGGDQSRLVFNALLREVARAQGSTLPLAQNMYEGPGSPGERVIAHLVYLFAVLSYLLGMMARKENLLQESYYIHFAGHGSKFLQWLDVLYKDASRSIPQTFFLAGLNQDPRGIQVSVSLPGDDAKQEVGRGLLRPLTTDPTSNHQRVTFLGESGFSTGDTLPWHAPLSFDVLRTIEPPSGHLETSHLEQLAGFLNAFENDEAAAEAARALGIGPNVLDNTLRDAIYNRLFGPDSAWHRAQQEDGTLDHSLLEPFFIVEAKTLLEHVTDNYHLFDL